MPAHQSCTLVLALTCCLAAAAAAPAQERGVAYSFSVAGEVGPAAQRALVTNLAAARRAGAAVVIMRLDTPGGLLESTREMIKDMIAAPVPVIVYVHPSGGRADSAGLLLTLAGDVAAMAPATNIGSATPVRFGPRPRSPSEEATLRDLRRKAINGVAAYARTLAEEHGRNARLAERMVFSALNVSATRARREGLVDVIAPDEATLLRGVDGLRVRGRKARVLRTAGLPIERAAAPQDAALDDLEDLDASSPWRSLAYVVGLPIAVVLAVLALRRVPSRWRRWRRRRRVRSAQRR